MEIVEKGEGREEGEIVESDEGEKRVRLRLWRRVKGGRRVR